jgi:hydrogenase/urease accessory protein HupE
MGEREGVVLAAALGVFHGQMNGVEMAAAGIGLTGLLGTVATLFVCVALVTGLVVSLRPTWTRVAVRVAGSWIVAVGLLYLGWTLGGQG